MAAEHSRSGLGRIFPRRINGRHTQPTDYRFDFAQRQTAMSEQHRLFGSKRYDRRFQTDGTRAAVKHRVDAITQPVDHVLSGRGADATERIGARCGNGTARFAQKLQGERMSRNAQSHRRQTRSDQVRDDISLRQHQRQRSRPECISERCSLRRKIRHQTSGLLTVGHVNNQRVERWPPLGFEDSCDRRRICCIRSQSIHRFRGEGDQQPASNFLSDKRNISGDHCRNGQSLAFWFGDRRRQSMIRAANFSPYSYGDNMPDAGVLATILLIVGLFLLALELMIPSFGIIGICAAITLLISAWCAWQAWWGTSPGFFWTYVSFWVLGIPAVFVGMLVTMQYTKLGDAVVLRGPGKETASPTKQGGELQTLVGTNGKALTLLTPGGMVSVDGERFHAESPGMLIEPETAIQVVAVKGTRLVVKPTTSAPSGSAPSAGEPTAAEPPVAELAKTVVPQEAAAASDASSADKAERASDFATAQSGESRNGNATSSAVGHEVGRTRERNANGDILDFDVPENYTAG